MLDIIVITVLSIGLAVVLAAALAFFIGYFLVSVPAAIISSIPRHTHRTHHLRPAH